MVICICFNKTQSEIMDAITEGFDTFDKLINELNVTKGCGICTCSIKELLLEKKEKDV